MGILKENLQMINWVESSNRKKEFERDWINYIFSFEDLEVEKNERSYSDRDLEAYYCGCDVSKPLSQSDKLKVKRYRREDCKR